MLYRRPPVFRGGLCGQSRFNKSLYMPLLYYTIVIMESQALIVKGVGANTIPPLTCFGVSLPSNFFPA